MALEQLQPQNRRRGGRYPPRLRMRALRTSLRLAAHDPLLPPEIILLGELNLSAATANDVNQPTATHLFDAVGV
jgi:hypothetical protein